MRASVLLLSFSLTVLISALLQAVPARWSPPGRGVLLLAHGGRAEWNANVLAIAAEVNRVLPTEVAFGMASRPAMAGAIDRLLARGVRDVVAVPLFVSSHSSVIESTAYLLGLRDEMPQALPMLARMAHAGGDAAAHHEPSGPPDLSVIRGPVPIRMTAALDAHPIVSEILTRRALEVSRDPEREAVVLVAHGPNDEAADARWLENLGRLAAEIRTAVPFSRVDAVTLRDDAPPDVRDAATAALRGVVARHAATGLRVLVVPVLLSYGGIEAGLRDRLEGLDWTMVPRGLAPDPRLVDWVLAQAFSASARW
jgi:sirohydrochlorin ferrochelatase